MGATISRGDQHAARIQSDPDSRHVMHTFHKNSSPYSHTTFCPGNIAVRQYGISISAWERWQFSVRFCIPSGGRYDSIIKNKINLHPVGRRGASWWRGSLARTGTEAGVNKWRGTFAPSRLYMYQRKNRSSAQIVKRCWAQEGSRDSKALIKLGDHVPPFKRLPLVET